MKNFFNIIFLKLSFFLMPVIALAQNTTVNFYNNTGGNPSACKNEVGSLADVFDLGVCILRKSVWPLLISLSVIVFVVGVIKYIGGADDATKRTEGRNFMLYGIVALFVMISVWGLVGVLQGTFGLGNTTFIPQLEE